MASCILHNYILQKNGEIDAELINEGDDHEREIINIEPDDHEFEDEEDDTDLSFNDASIKRMAIVNDLFQLKITCIYKKNCKFIY